MSHHLPQMFASIAASMASLVLTATAWHEHPIVVGVAVAVIAGGIWRAVGHLGRINQAVSKDLPQRLELGDRRFDELDSRVAKLEGR